jgi:hypothetical protein
MVWGFMCYIRPLKLKKKVQATLTNSLTDCTKLDRFNNLSWSTGAEYDDSLKCAASMITNLDGKALVTSKQKDVQYCVLWSCQVDT